MEALGFRQYYFQFTLNDYVREGLEPNVPPVAERIDTFKRLADRIGKERVIWRFDPLMLGPAADTAVGPPAQDAQVLANFARHRQCLLLPLLVPEE